MDLTTPALLFPAISLLLLAYTNRFLVLAQLIRQLHESEGKNGHNMVLRQIANLKKRLFLVRAMQTMGVSSFIACTISMFLLFLKRELSAEFVFGASLILLVASLVISLYEIMISTRAIEIELDSLGESGNAIDSD